MPGLLGPTDCGIGRQTHEADVCIVGGGLSGLCAALAAARHGAQVLLMHDRPVLGGNASSEVRMHICGADRHGAIPNLRETGILEELRLENARRNPAQSYSIWDAVLYEKARLQPGLDLLLNCTCQAAEMEGDHIAAVTGWQMTTQIHHTVRARLFVDCSGDAILAPLSGAEFRMGREGRAEYGESIAPEEPDAHTMGLSCMFMARRYDTPQPFEPPAWAYDFPNEEDLPYGARGHDWLQYGYWWIELGGDRHSLYDAEAVRDELLRIVFGVWDHVKNHGDHGAENWALDWVQFLPGKRESRRYIGDHVLTQNDVEAEGRFDDVVAYGGWPMDDHHPAGFWAARLGQPATVFHPCPSPYGIPYRALYSRNVENLLFAGRSASCTHAAMSSARVMGTCCSMGQAVGTAAAIAVREGLTPRQVGAARIRELQQTLLRDDCYLPWVRQEFGPLTQSARLISSAGDPEPLRDGVSRPVGADSHAWPCAEGSWVAYLLPRTASVQEVTLVFDSALDRLLTLDHDRPRQGQLYTVPPTMVKAFHLDGLVDGHWVRLREITSNHQRLVRLNVGREVEAVRLTIDETWGSEMTRLFALYLD
ncbi:MAG: FAD-dependent oxidoreductase [Anaerolineae bacterium]|nr:FAD-dependent oxidoreductase [Anaerolineae bacterium]